MKRVLSISGGGMRGAIAARHVVEIEYRIPGITWDLIAGTSTGAIIGACLSKPQPMKGGDVLSWYANEGPKVFNNHFFGIGQLFDSKYPAGPLAASLSNCIGLHFMPSTSTLFTCATVDADHVRPVWIDGGCKDWMAWEAALASSSAETYFPAFRKNGTRYIDGGNFANCPARHVALLAKRLWPGEQITVVHLGTGKEYDPKPCPSGGALSWAPVLPMDLFALQDHESQRDADQVADVFFSLDVMLKRLPALDDASRETINGYVSAVEQGISSRPQIWDALTIALSSK